MREPYQYPCEGIRNGPFLATVSRCDCSSDDDEDSNDDDEDSNDDDDGSFCGRVLIYNALCNSV